MNDCEFMIDCSFFNDRLQGEKEQRELLKSKYCSGTNLNCARYMVILAAGQERMPENLFPHQKDRAYEAISKI